jgi:hypothetical protein
MSIHSFLSALFNDGRVRVDPLVAPTEEDLQQADELLAAFERQYRDELPGTPPPFARPAARQGAWLLYRVCQFLVFRDLDAETMRRELCHEPDAASSPSVHYAVDLTLRFLPDAVRLARGKASGDPLVTELLRLATHWPLSSVGVSGVGDVTVDAFVEDPCLRRLYVDRIIARQDLSRLCDERVRAEVAGVVGSHPELAPEIAGAIQPLAPGLSPLLPSALHE